MTAPRRIAAEFAVGWRSFVRRPTAVFFTFLFPVILVVIFGALVRTGPGGLFGEDPAYYLPGYLAVVVLFTPLTRLASTVTRHRDGRRFEKLATTPLTRWEWLLARTFVNVVLVAIASAFVLALAIGLTGASPRLSPALVPFVVLGTILFCGVGALLGRLADSRDGAVAASNAIGLPLLFLSETFVPPAMLPGWFRPLLSLSPLTYFARGARTAVLEGSGWGGDLLVVLLLAAVAFALGAVLLPWRS